MKIEADRAREIDELLLDSLVYYTRELYDAAAEKAPASVISSLNRHLVSSYHLCLGMGIPHLTVAKRFLEEMPQERRNSRIDVFKRILPSEEYRELANHFGVRR